MKQRGCAAGKGAVQPHFVMWVVACEPAEPNADDRLVAEVGVARSCDEVNAPHDNHLPGNLIILRCLPRITARTPPMVSIDSSRPATGKVQKFKLREQYWQGQARQVN